VFKDAENALFRKEGNECSSMDVTVFGAVRKTQEIHQRNKIER